MNHITTNLVTKGLLNISNITKGMILVSYEIVFRKRGGGGGSVPTPKLREVPLHYDKETLFYEIQKHDEEDIDFIKVHVNWKDPPLKGYKKVDVKLLKAHIESEILQETNKKITVQIIS
jgi:hypothetical protein